MGQISNQSNSRQFACCKNGFGCNFGVSKSTTAVSFLNGLTNHLYSSNQQAFRDEYVEQQLTEFFQWIKEKTEMGDPNEYGPLNRFMLLSAIHMQNSHGEELSKLLSDELSFNVSINLTNNFTFMFRLVTRCESRSQSKCFTCDMQCRRTQLLRKPFNWM